MKRKIKWGNWLLLIALIVCLITIGTDVFKIAIHRYYQGVIALIPADKL